MSLTNALQQARTQTLNTLREAFANIDAIEDAHPGEAGPLALNAIAWLERHNAVVKSMVDSYGPACRTLEIPTREFLPLFLALGRSNVAGVKSIVKAFGVPMPGSVYKIDRGDAFRSRYAANPIVLWEHGFDPATPTPIASSENPATGELSLQSRRTIR